MPDYDLLRIYRSDLKTNEALYKNRRTCTVLFSCNYLEKCILIFQNEIFYKEKKYKVKKTRFCLLLIYSTYFKVTMCIFEAQKIIFTHEIQ